MDSEAVEACVLGRFRRMKFPSPAGGSTVTFPLVFETD
jgi:hypothetical protein